MASEIFSKSITVLSEHTDEHNHVNNVVYLQWVQDIAREHWMRRAPEEVQEKYFWVVRTHQLEYKKQVFEGSVIEVRTWVEDYKGPFSVRVVEFRLNDELIVEARSNWCMLGREDQKPKRVPEDLQKIFGTPD